MKDKTKRRQFTAEKKAAILREHMEQKMPVSEVCEKHSLQPSVFYLWQKQLFENAALVLDKRGTRQANRLGERTSQRVTLLESKLTQKDHVIAELLQEHIALKKELGEP